MRDGNQNFSRRGFQAKKSVFSSKGSGLKLASLIKTFNRGNQARLAQLVERGTFNPEAKGSSPLSGVHVYRTHSPKIRLRES